MLGRRGSRNTAKRRAKQQRMSRTTQKRTNDARRRPTGQKAAAVAGPVPKKFLPVIGPTGRSAKVKQKKVSPQAAKQMKGSQRGIMAAVKQLKQRKSTTPTAQQKQMADARKASRTTTRRPKMTAAQIAAIRRRQKAAIDARRRPTDARRRPPTEAERIAASKAFKQRNKERIRSGQRPLRTPDIDDFLAAAKRASGRTGSGTLEARTNAAKAMNKIKRDMRQPPKTVRRQTEAARERMIDLAKKRRQALQERRRGFAAKLEANRDNRTRGRRGRRLDAKYRNT